MRYLDSMLSSNLAVHAHRPEIIVFGEDWGAHPSSTQHLIKRLIPECDVVWVNSLGLRRPKVNLRDMKRAAMKMGAMMTRDQKPTMPEDTMMPIIAPRAVSWPSNPLACKLNGHLLERQIDSVIRQRGMDMPILWASMPSAIDAIDRYPHNKVIYYCGDDFRALAGVDHKPVAKMELRLAERADLIIVASKELQNRFPAHKTILVEHGVDYDLFAKDAPRADDLPDHPLIAGFYGSIHGWIDLGMISQAATACPNWQFVLIGDVHVDVSILSACENVTLLGARPHSELPRYAQHWQASMLPFKDCAQIRACNPLKLKEYLSAGQPVMTTEFPAMQSWRDNVRTIKTVDDMACALHSIHKDGDTARKPLATMQSETWDAKAKAVRQHIVQLA